MAGRMGNVKKTIQNLEVIEIDTERNLIFIKGSIAGHDNSFVVITPSIKSKQKEREIFKTPIDETPEVEAQAEEAPHRRNPRSRRRRGSTSRRNPRIRSPSRRGSTNRRNPRSRSPSRRGSTNRRNPRSRSR